jgi:hypothetical protein
VWGDQKLLKSNALLYVTFALKSDERRLTQRLQQQLNDATMELQQRAIDFELGGSGAAAQRMQQELAELAGLRTCNNDLLAEVRTYQKDLKAKDFLLAAQKAAAAAASDKAAAAIQQLKEQVVDRVCVSLGFSAHMSLMSDVSTPKSRCLTPL